MESATPGGNHPLRTECPICNATLLFPNGMNRRTCVGCGTTVDRPAEVFPKRASAPAAINMAGVKKDFDFAFSNDSTQVKTLDRSSTGSSLASFQRRLGGVFCCLSRRSGDKRKNSCCFRLLACLPYVILLAAGLLQSLVAAGVARLYCACDGPLEAWIASLGLSGVQFLCLLLIVALNLCGAGHGRGHAHEAYHTSKGSSMNMKGSITEVLSPLMDLTIKLNTTSVKDCATAIQNCMTAEDSAVLNRLLRQLHDSLAQFGSPGNQYSPVTSGGGTPPGGANRTPPKEREKKRREMRRMVSFSNVSSSSSEESNASQIPVARQDSAGILKKSQSAQHEFRRSNTNDTELTDLQDNPNKRSSSAHLLRHSDTDISVSSFTAWNRDKRSFTVSSGLGESLDDVPLSPEAEAALELQRSLANDDELEGLQYRSSVVQVEDLSDPRDSHGFRRMDTHQTAITSASDRRAMMWKMADPSKAEEVGNFQWNLDGTAHNSDHFERDLADSDRLLRRYDRYSGSSESGADACSVATEDTICTAKLLDIALHSHWDGPGPSHPSREERRHGRPKSRNKFASNYTSHSSSPSTVSPRQGSKTFMQIEDHTDTLDDHADSAMARIEALLREQQKNQDRKNKSPTTELSVDNVVDKLMPRPNSNTSMNSIMRIQAKSPSTPRRSDPPDRPERPEMVPERPEQPERPFFQSIEQPEMLEISDVRPERPVGPLFVSDERPEMPEMLDSPSKYNSRPSGPEPVEPQKSEAESMADKKKAWEERRARVKQSKAGKVRYGDVIRQNHEQFIGDVAGDQQQPSIACTLSAPLPVPGADEREEEPMAKQPNLVRNKTTAGQVGTEEVEYSAAQKWEERRRRKEENKKKGLNTYGAHLRSMYEDNVKEVVTSLGGDSQVPSFAPSRNESNVPSFAPENESIAPEQRNQSDQSLPDSEASAQRCFSFGRGLGRPPQQDCQLDDVDACDDQPSNISC